MVTWLFVIIQVVLDLMSGRLSLMLIPLYEVLFKLLSRHNLFVRLIQGEDFIFVF